MRRGGRIRPALAPDPPRPEIMLLCSYAAAETKDRSVIVEGDSCLQLRS